MRRFLFTLLMVGAGASVLAQCIPSEEFTGSGMDFIPLQPDPIYACAECADHEVVISLRTFTDTMLTIELSPGNPSDITVFADHFRLDSIAGLPAGLTYTTDAAFDTTYDEQDFPFGYWFNGGDTAVGLTSTTGCITISGSAADWSSAAGGGPANDGIYPLTLYIDARVAGFDPSALTSFVAPGTWLTEMGPLLSAFGDTNFTESGIRYDTVSLDIRPSALGIDESAAPQEHVSIFPNPMQEHATVKFNAQGSADAEVVLTNILGKTVLRKQVTAQKGVNTISLSSSGLATGVYLLAIEVDGERSVHRMVIR